MKIAEKSGNSYEAPAIVRAIQAEELSREAHYAGVGTTGSQGPQEQDA